VTEAAGETVGNGSVVGGGTMGGKGGGASNGPVEGAGGAPIGLSFRKNGWPVPASSLCQPL
jgi:hypothetical protein